MQNLNETVVLFNYINILSELINLNDIRQININLMQKDFYYMITAAKIIHNNYIKCNIHRN